MVQKTGIGCIQQNQSGILHISFLGCKKLHSLVSKMQAIYRKVHPQHLHALNADGILQNSGTSRRPGGPRKTHARL